MIPTCTGVNIVSKLAFLQENCPSKRVGWINWWWRRWYKENVYLIWPYKPRQISQIYFALQGSEWASKTTWCFTILASNKKGMCNTVDSANAISVDFGRFNFSHLIIHEFFKMCHLFVYIRANIKLFSERVSKYHAKHWANICGENTN